MTSKRWLRTLAARIAKVVFSFSLLLTCISWGADDFGTVSAELNGKTAQEVVAIVAREHKRGAFDSSPKLKAEVDRLLERAQRNPAASADRLRHIVDLLAVAGQRGGGQDPATVAAEIKRNPLYRDPGVQQQANWLSEAAGRISNISVPATCGRASCSSACRPRASNMRAPRIDWITSTIWVLLGSAAVVFLYLVFRHFAWTRSLERKARALLDEDEPERTLDEYLELADKLAAEGRHREAVRCLYLACLLKLDQARVLRFHRGQTNWEHLARFEASPRKPADLALRGPTKTFDHIWYGMRPADQGDVDSFRQTYQAVSAASRAAAA